MKLYPIVMVTWDDANVADSSVDHVPKRMYTVGFLMRRDKVGVSIAAETSDEKNDVRSVTFIPAAMVVKVRRLR